MNDLELDTLKELVRVCKEMNELLKTASLMAYTPGVQHYLPYGLQEQLENFVKQSYIDRAIAKANDLVSLTKES